ncbi:PepSY domain-containing protein [Methyloligella solikamskensis]|uniref:PepSY domain-containing protein n=1 Tax=Methyloligella solikamskensis TaxID=1177756 RepID=A0ABW3J900_9HYPH
MWRLLRHSIAPLLFGVLVSLWAGPAAAECLPWSAAGPVIQKNGLIPAGRIYNQIQSKHKGQIIKATLCRNGNSFRYKFTVLGAKGDVKTVSVDARTGR